MFSPFVSNEKKHTSFSFLMMIHSLISFVSRFTGTASSVRCRHAATRVRSSRRISKWIVEFSGFSRRSRSRVLPSLRSHHSIQPMPHPLIRSISLSVVERSFTSSSFKALDYYLSLVYCAKIVTVYELSGSHAMTSA